MSLIDEIIGREGNLFTNKPADKGGPTKFGITQKTLSNYRKKEVTVKDVEDLTEEEARAIYQSLFIDNSPFVNLIPVIRDMLIDWTVTSGSDDPTKAIQTLINEHGGDLKVDGVFGSKTRAAFETFLVQWGQPYVYNKLIDLRVLFYIKVAKKDPSQLEFITGWANRAFSFRKY